MQSQVIHQIQIERMMPPFAWGLAYGNGKQIVQPVINHLFFKLTA